MRPWTKNWILTARVAATAGLILGVVEASAQWARHTIDDTSRGADGARLEDVNGNGLPDMAVPWEEGGVVRVYLHPGLERVREPWPSVTVGRVGSPEDAVLVDLDGDGAFDVVSSCEGDTRTVYIHWAPSGPDRYLDETAWTTTAIDASRGLAQWMFCLPMDMDGDGDVDLVVGSKNDGAAVGWFECPPDPRDTSAWVWHPLYAAGWIMSIEAVDVTGDGNPDIVVSDRRGDHRGVLWFENRGNGRWPVHRVGTVGVDEVMFLTAGRFREQSRLENVSALHPGGYVAYRHSDAGWEETRVTLPMEGRIGKSVAVADVTGDGKLEVVYSCERAGGKSGVFAAPYLESGPIIDISGPEGIKYDLVVLADMNGNGALDVVTTEENDGLGVVWYENPFARGDGD